MSSIGPRTTDGTWPVASTRLLAVLGWPVAHSRSPALHNAALAADGLDAVYLALAVAPEQLAPVVAGLGAMGAVGANVTVPHKQAVVGACDRLTDEARLIGAVNTLHWTDDGLLGDNTDARGFVASLRDLGPLRDRAVTVLGAGGAARAVVVGLAREGARLTIAARRVAAAQELAALAERAGGPPAQAAALADDGLGWLPDADLIVNATPLGMAGERLPQPCHALTAGQVAVDLIYAPSRTPFLADAARVGAVTVNGAGMLVHQAALAYARWTGRAAPVEAMLAAFDGR